MRITEDMVLGAKYRMDKSGPSLSRIFVVSGLVAGRDTLAQAGAAVDDVSFTRIPRYGEPHPGVPGLFAIEIDAEPIHDATTAARVTVKYGTPTHASLPGAARIRIISSTGSKLITQLPDGSLIAVKYTDPDGNMLSEHLQIHVLSPNTILEITRQEASSPLRLSTQFRRTVNSSTWQGGAPKTWLCRAIDAASIAPSRFEVRYEFEHDPDGWERLEYFVDRYTGKIPDDVKISNDNDQGITKLLPYNKRDFSQLGLPNAF